MNTNAKFCSYKGCENSSIQNTELTFFGFPLKNAEKCRKWATLAGIDVLNTKPKYLCEIHFNPIFLSRTPRRTVLLPTAIPYAYNSDEAEKDLSTDDLGDAVAIIFDPLDDDGGLDEANNKSTHSENNIDIDNGTSSVCENGVNAMEQPSFVNVTKRQKCRVDTKPANVIDNTIENPDIATFIFKGEEYIQMPKSIYLQQRSEMDAEIQKYRRIVANIKHLIGEFNV